MEPSKTKPGPRVFPKNPGLLELIRLKREWHWKPSLDELRQGFRGWHQRGYLPHFDAPGITQMLTFMLHDSFPVERRREWEPILREADDSVKRRKLEAWLDRGHGACWLARAEVAEAVERVLTAANGQQYLLQAWVVMPNHVHVVVDVWDVPLTKLVATWKGKSSRLANLALRKQGRFWQEDYYDTRVRDQEHLTKAIHYAEYNPIKACLVRQPQDWLWCSARRRDLRGKLPWHSKG